MAQPLYFSQPGTNLVRIPQRTEARTPEDFKQFTVMGFVVRQVLRDLVARGVCLDTMDERALEKLRMEIKASGTDERT